MTTEKTDLFEKATRRRLRYNSPKGTISTEDLWDLTMKELDTTARDVNELLAAKGETSFLPSAMIKKTTEDFDNETRLEIVKHVIKTKHAENLSLAEKRSAKEHNDTVAQIINRKKQAALEEMSIEDLEKTMIKT